MIGDIVLYTINTQDVDLANQLLPIAVPPTTKMPQVGQQYAAVVTVDHGSDVVSLRVLLDGPDVLVRRTVAKGLAGTPGVWAPRA